MGVKRIGLTVNEELYAKILNYSKETGASSQQQAIIHIVEQTLNDEQASDVVLQKLEELEHKLDENTKASYGTLHLLSFIYKDICFLMCQKVTQSVKRFKYWASRPAKDIFMFFRYAGGSASSQQKIDFWRSYEMAVKNSPFKEASGLELLGLDENELNRKVKRTNDATAVRMRKS